MSTVLVFSTAWYTPIHTANYSVVIFGNTWPSYQTHWVDLSLEKSPPKTQIVGPFCLVRPLNNLSKMGDNRTFLRSMKIIENRLEGIFFKISIILLHYPKSFPHQNVFLHIHPLLHLLLTDQGSREAAVRIRSHMKNQAKSRSLLETSVLHEPPFLVGNLRLKDCATQSSAPPVNVRNPDRPMKGGSSIENHIWNRGRE